MDQQTVCHICQKRQKPLVVTFTPDASETPKRRGALSALFAKIRRAIVRPRLDPIRKAVTAAAASDFAGELRLVIVASLLAGAAVISMIYVVNSLLD
mgnify:CR=1 FL=1